MLSEVTHYVTEKFACCVLVLFQNAICPSNAPNEIGMLSEVTQYVTEKFACCVLVLFQNAIVVEIAYCL